MEKNDFLRQVISYEYPNPNNPWQKDNYGVRDDYRELVKEVLQELGDLAESVEVEVSEDKVHGSLAAIKIQAGSGATEDQIKDKVDELLARYTVKYDLKIIK
jgi:hypothetical protein